MKITKEYTERLKREQEKMWQYCEEYKNRIEYPLHPDTEMRIKNSWLMGANVENILEGQKDCESNIEKVLNDYSILFRKNTIHPNGKTMIIFDIPTQDGTYKIVIKA